MTALPASQRARKGIARSFQMTSLCPEFTALENVVLAVQAHAGPRFRMLAQRRGATHRWSSRRASCSRRSGSASAPMCRLGSWPTASSGSSRSPWRSPPSRALLLLDEPMAGMGREESDAADRAARAR